MTLAEKVYLHSLARKEAADLVSKYAADAEDIALGAGGATIGGLALPGLDKLRGIIQRYDKGSGRILAKADALDTKAFREAKEAARKAGEVARSSMEFTANTDMAKKLIGLSRSKPAKLVSKYMGKYHKLGKGGKAGAIAALAAILGSGAFGVSDALRKG